MKVLAIDQGTTLTKAFVLTDALEPCERQDNEYRAAYAASTISHTRFDAQAGSLELNLIGPSHLP
jgi:hypothetical protein